METPGWPTWIAVVCDDVEAQRLFYAKVLGWRQLDEGGDRVRLDGDDGKALELIERKKRRDEHEERGFVAGFAVEDIERCRDELIAVGATPLSGLLGDEDAGGRWCYFRDPEGNVFALKESD